MALLGAGCGGTGTFKNETRPPEPIQLNGVISGGKLTIEPSQLGGGPVLLLIANETDNAETITLERSGNEGTPTRDVVGPVNPGATATVQESLSQGSYTVSVDSSGSIEPATLTVGPERTGSSGTLLLP